MEHYTGRKRWGKRNGRRSDMESSFLWWHFSVQYHLWYMEKILIPKKQSVLDILIMEGLSIWTKMGSIQDMAWNCWIRSLSIPDGSTNMCMTHGTISWKNWSQVRLIWSVRRREHRNVRRDSCFRSIGREQKPVFFMQEWMMTGIITMILRLLTASGWQDWRKVFRMMIWKNMLKRMIFRLSWKNTWRQKNVFRHWRKVLWMQSYRDRLSGWTIIRLSAGLEHSHFIWWQESRSKR